MGFRQQTSPLQGLGSWTPAGDVSSSLEAAFDQMWAVESERGFAAIVADRMAHVGRDTGIRYPSQAEVAFWLENDQTWEQTRDMGRGRAFVPTGPTFEQELEARRAKGEQLPSLLDIVASARSEVEDIQQARQITAAKRTTAGGLFGTVVGTVAGGLNPETNPTNFLSLFVPVPGAGVLTRIGAEVAIGSGAELVSQATGVVENKRQMGIATTPEDIAFNVLVAGAGAGLIRGGLEGGGALLSRLAPDVQALPPHVRDAAEAASGREDPQAREVLEAVREQLATTRQNPYRALPDGEAVFRSEYMRVAARDTVEGMEGRGIPVPDELRAASALTPPSQARIHRAETLEPPPSAVSAVQAREVRAAVDVSRMEATPPEVLVERMLRDVEPGLMSRWDALRSRRVEYVETLHEMRQRAIDRRAEAIEAELRTLQETAERATGRRRARLRNQLETRRAEAAEELLEASRTPDPSENFVRGKIRALDDQMQTLGPDVKAARDRLRPLAEAEAARGPRVELLPDALRPPPSVRVGVPVGKLTPEQQLDVQDFFRQAVVTARGTRPTPDARPVAERVAEVVEVADNAGKVADGTARIARQNEAFIRGEHELPLSEKVTMEDGSEMTLGEALERFSHEEKALDRMTACLTGGGA